MNQEERIIRITEFLEEHKTMNMKQMCELFHISRDTARRDIVKMTQQGLVVRTHGGVALPSFYRKVDDYISRLNEESETKESIGKKAGRLIQDQDMIYLDVSTTVQFISEFIQAHNVEVVTNSIDTAVKLMQSSNTTIHLLGGVLNKKSRHVTGISVLEKLKDFHFNKVFLGAWGITEEGIYYGFEEDIYLKRELAKRTDQLFVLADHSKFNQKSPYRALSLSDVNSIITNKQISHPLSTILAKNKVEVCMVEKN